MTVSLYCNVSGFKVSFVWERTKVNDDSLWERIENSQNYKYIVRNIQKTQQYRCTAGNDAGALVSNPATIKVLSKYIYLCNYTNLYNISDMILEITINS